MKLNNKGFAISSIMYIILVLAVVLIALTLAVLSSRKLILDKLKNEVTNIIYEVYPTTYRQTLNILKEEAIAYASSNNIEKDSVKISDFETSIDENTINGYKLSDKYLTMASNDDSYDIYLGEEETIKNTTELPKKTVDIIDYKIYGNSMQGKLPSEYQQVEYIESTGTQYIDTNIKMNENTKLELKTSIDAHNGDLLGVEDASNCFAIAYAGGSEWFRFYASSGKAVTTTETNPSYTIDKDKLYVDGELKFTEADYSYADIDLNLYLLARNRRGTATGFASRKLYYFRMYQNDVLVRNMIPCYRKSDNEIGMYDLVNGVFYTNAGTGTFSKGNNAPTPEVPIEVESVGEYDETNGKYKIPVITRSRNILPFPYYSNSKTQAGVTWTVNEDRSITASGLPTGYVIFDIAHRVKIESDTDYTFNLGLNSGYENIVLVITIFDANNTTLSTTTVHSVYDYTNQLAKDILINGISGAKYMDIQVKRGHNNLNTYAVFKPTLEKGNVTTSYEDYVEPLTSNIYLSEPLRKIGDYDDYIDSTSDKVIRKIKKVKFSGSEPILTLSTDYFPYNYYNLGKLDEVVNDICLCTHLSHQSNFSYTIQGNNKFRILNSYTNGYARFVFRFYLDNKIVYDNAKISELLTSYYNSGNPLTIYYALPQKLQLENNIELQKINTPIGATKISIDTEIKPSSYEFTVVKELKQL